MTNEPEQRGVEYPSLEKAPPPQDLPPPLEYPTYPAYPPTPPQYPQAVQPPTYAPNPYGANPYAANPYAANPYGAPPYGFAPQPRTNGLAIASLATALVGIPACFGFGITSIAAIVLGLIGMNQIKTSGEKGYGMALSGVIIGGVTIVLCVLFFVIVIAADSN